MNGTFSKSKWDVDSCPTWKDGRVGILMLPMPHLAHSASSTQAPSLVRLFVADNVAMRCAQYSLSIDCLVSESIGQ